MAKLVATETANICADETVQILGGDGLTKEYGRAEQIFRDARALTIVGGTSEMARYLIAASALTVLLGTAAAWESKPKPFRSSCRDAI